MILESDEKAPLLKFIQDVEMEQRLNDIYQGVSFADTEMHKLNFRPYKMGKGFELMSLCWSALNRKGYLKHISHSTPSNIPSNNQLSGSAETEMAPACFQKYGNPTLGRNCVTCEIRKICNV
jgi:hypothetical protein